MQTLKTTKSSHSSGSSNKDSSENSEQRRHPTDSATGEERFSVSLEEQKAMSLLGTLLKMQREGTAYDLQNLPFDPAVESKRTPEESEDLPDLALKRLYKVLHQSRQYTGQTRELSPSLKKWLQEMESRSSGNQNMSK